MKPLFEFMTSEIGVLTFFLKETLLLGRLIAISLVH